MKYYVSANGSDDNDGYNREHPIRTIDHLNHLMRPGDRARFHCGDTFYGQIKPPSMDRKDMPTTCYDSYGEGDKPVVSQYKIAKPEAWHEYSDGIWAFDLGNTENFDGNVSELDTNVGFIRVSGKIYGNKRVSINELVKPWDFCTDKNITYIKSDANPSELSDEICFACNISCMYFGNSIDICGIVFRGSGGHGLNGTVTSAHVDGCEFHELGGSELPGYSVPNTRYGNGIECWANSSDVLIENCHFSNIYDVAFTMQGDGVITGWDNIIFRNCVIWDCQQCFEIWSIGDLPDTGFKHCFFENNICLNSGHYWGYESRRDKDNAAHLLMYNLRCPLTDITVRGNVFENAKSASIFKLGGPSTIPHDYRIIGNTFIIPEGQNFIFRGSCSDSEYNAFADTLKRENRVVISYKY